MTNQEINEAVAKRLGWLVSPTLGAWCPPPPNVDLEQFSDVPDYCGSIEAAFEIVMHYLETGGEFGIWRSGDLKRWHAHFDIFEFEEDSDTAPMAICLAFLKLPPA